MSRQGLTGVTMSVSGITSALGIYQASTVGPAQQWRDLLNQLGSALDQGNVSGAKRAFQSLDQLRSGLSTSAFAAITGTSGSSSGQGVLSTDLAAVGQALKSGSLANAQAAFVQFQNDLQASLRNTNPQGVSAYSNTTTAAAFLQTLQSGDPDGDSSGNGQSATSAVSAGLAGGNSTFSILG